MAKTGMAITVELKLTVCTMHRVSMSVKFFMHTDTILIVLYIASLRTDALGDMGRLLTNIKDSNRWVLPSQTLLVISTIVHYIST